MLGQVLWVALGGAIGALSRWGLGALVKGCLGDDLPWGTAAANVLGALLFGVVWAATEGRGGLTVTARLALLTGFMGSFTTFSTYLFDTVSLLQVGRYGAAVAQLAGQLLLGLGAVFFGLWFGRVVLS